MYPLWTLAYGPPIMHGDHIKYIDINKRNEHSLPLNINVCLENFYELKIKIWHPARKKKHEPAIINFTVQTALSQKKTHSQKKCCSKTCVQLSVSLDLGRTKVIKYKRS